MDNAKLLYLKVENQNFQILMVSVTHCVMDSQCCGKSIQLAYAGLADQWPVSKKLGPFFCADSYTVVGMTCAGAVNARKGRRGLAARERRARNERNTPREKEKSFFLVYYSFDKFLISPPKSRS